MSKHNKYKTLFVGYTVRHTINKSKIEKLIFQKLLKISEKF